VIVVVLAIWLPRFRARPRSEDEAQRGGRPLARTLQ
jgi:hypothetical protein